MSIIKTVMKGRSDVYRVDPKDLVIKDGWNNRELDTPENVEHLRQTKESIRTVGVKEPLTVFIENETLYVSDGHVRLTAVRELIKEGVEIATVPVKTEGRYTSDADLLFSQIVRNAGKTFTPFEKGKVFKRLIDYGWTEDDIATRAGMTRQQVVGMLELQAAPVAVQKMVKTGEVAATTAVKAIRQAKGDGKAAERQLSKAVETAKAQGRTKARPRDVEGTGKTFKQEIREIFGRATIIPGGVMFAEDDFQRVKTLLKVK